MLRKVLVGVCAFLVPFGLIVLIAPSSASAQTTLAGTYACDSGYGVMSFNPPLSLAGPFTTPDIVTVVGRMDRCTSVPAAISAGSFVYSGQLALNNCLQFRGGIGPLLTGGVSWEPHPLFPRPLLPLLPSYQSYGAAVYVPAGRNLKPTFSWTGITTYGSYLGSAVSFSITLRLTVNDIVALCSREDITSLGFSDFGN